MMTDSVVRLDTADGRIIIVHNNPDERSVRNAVRIQNERFDKNLPGGPDGNPAMHIEKAAYYPCEEDALNNKNRNQEINLEGN